MGRNDAPREPDRTGMPRRWRRRWRVMKGRSGRGDGTERGWVVVGRARTYHRLSRKLRRTSQQQQQQQRSRREVSSTV